MSTTTQPAATEAEFNEWMAENRLAFARGTLEPYQVAFLDENMPGWSDGAIRERINAVALAWRAAGWSGAEPQAKPVPSMNGLGSFSLIEYAAMLSLRLEGLDAGLDGIEDVTNNRDHVTAAFAEGIEPYKLAAHTMKVRG